MAGPKFSIAERAIIRFAREMGRTPNEIADELYEKGYPLRSAESINVHVARNREYFGGETVAAIRRKRRHIDAGFPVEWRLTDLELKVLKGIQKELHRNRLEHIVASDKNLTSARNNLSVYIHNIRKKIAPWVIYNNPSGTLSLRPPAKGAFLPMKLPLQRDWLILY